MKYNELLSLKISKEEFLKILTDYYISRNERTITVQDNYEIDYSQNGHPKVKIHLMYTDTHGKHTIKNADVTEILKQYINKMDGEFYAYHYQGGVRLKENNKDLKEDMPVFDYITVSYTNKKTKTR